MEHANQIRTSPAKRPASAVTEGLNMIYRILFLLIIAVACVNCASNSGVYRVGQNTYQVSTQATWELGGRVGAMRMAMQDATKFCSEHGGKQLKVIKETDDYGHFQGGIVNLTFSCE